MSLYEKIGDLIDEEVNHRLVAMMNEYIEIISKKHGISTELLMKDIPGPFTGTICKGVKNNGHRCQFRGVFDGYCKHHIKNNNRGEFRVIPRTNSHIHGPDQMYVKGCPGCEVSKELIDLNTMIGNE
jgi:hypothetical protein